MQQEPAETLGATLVNSVKPVTVCRPSEQFKENVLDSHTIKGSANIFVLNTICVSADILCICSYPAQRHGQHGSNCASHHAIQLFSFVLPQIKN